MGALLLYKIYGEIRRQVGNRGFHTYLGCFKAKDGWILLSGTTNPSPARSPHETVAHSFQYNIPSS